MDEDGPNNGATQSSLHQDLKTAYKVLQNRGAPQVIRSSQVAGGDGHEDAAPVGTVHLEDPAAKSDADAGTEAEAEPEAYAGTEAGTGANAEAGTDAGTEAGAGYPEEGAVPEGGNPPPTEADVLFTEALRAELARDALGAPEDVAASLAASVLEECHWRLAVVRAEYTASVATAVKRHQSSTRLLTGLVQQVQANLEAVQGALMHTWRGARGALRARLLHTRQPALAQKVLTVHSRDTVVDVVQQVLGDPASALVWQTIPALQTVYYQGLMAGCLAAQLRDSQLELQAAQHVQDQRLQRLQEDFTAKAKEAVQACRTRLQDLSSKTVPPQGLQNIAPPPPAAAGVAAAAATAAAAAGGRHTTAHRSADRARALAAAATAAALVQQREAARRALQARVKYEMCVLEKNVLAM